MGEAVSSSLATSPSSGAGSGKTSSSGAVAESEDGVGASGDSVETLPFGADVDLPEQATTRVASMNVGAAGLRSTGGHYEGILRADSARGGSVGGGGARCEAAGQSGSVGTRGLPLLACPVRAGLRRVTEANDAAKRAQDKRSRMVRETWGWVERVRGVERRLPGPSRRRPRSCEFPTVQRLAVALRRARLLLIGPTSP
jgi:hypothetical protein